MICWEHHSVTEPADGKDIAFLLKEAWESEPKLNNFFNVKKNKGSEISRCLTELVHLTRQLDGLSLVDHDVEGFAGELGDCVDDFFVLVEVVCGRVVVSVGVEMNVAVVVFVGLRMR